MQHRRLIVTHHAPDMDAVGAVWLLKRFATQKFGDAKIAFVNPGDTISDDVRDALDVDPDLVTHVDTGLGEFDHHQPDRGQEFICATSLVYDYILQLHPDHEQDQALKAISDFVTEVDHFKEIYWPENNHPRYNFMASELLHGLENLELHDDDSMLHFGMTIYDAAYANLKLSYQAADDIKANGITFQLGETTCLAIETANDAVIKFAQKEGYPLVVRKDPHQGNIRIKARPDSDIELKAVATALETEDPQANWYYHPSGKMLLNGSRKKEQQASKLSLTAIVEIIKKSLG